MINSIFTVQLNRCICAYSGEADHRFHLMPITCSGHADHLSERSDAGVVYCAE